MIDAQPEPLLIDPIRVAEREWEKAVRNVDICLTHYRQERDRGLEEGRQMGSVTASVALAAAYDEEQTLRAVLDNLVSDVYASRNRRA